MARAMPPKADLWAFAAAALVVCGAVGLAALLHDLWLAPLATVAGGLVVALGARMGGHARFAASFAYALAWILAGAMLVGLVVFVTCLAILRSALA